MNQVSLIGKLLEDVTTVFINEKHTVIDNAIVVGHSKGEYVIPFSVHYEKDKNRLSHLKKGDKIFISGNLVNRTYKLPRNSEKVEKIYVYVTEARVIQS